MMDSFKEAWMSLLNRLQPITLPTQEARIIEVMDS